MEIKDCCKGFILGAITSTAIFIAAFLGIFSAEKLRLANVEKELVVSIRTTKEYDRDDINAIIRAFDAHEYNIKKYKCGQFGCSVRFTKTKAH